METPNEIQAINADEIVIKVPTQKRPAERSKSPKKTLAKSAKKLTQKTSSLSAEEKRLARNAALREWRKKNADRVKAYMAEWRAKREGKRPADPIAATSRTAPKPASKKSTSKKPKNGGKA